VPIWATIGPGRPLGSIERSEARQRAAEAVGRAAGRLDDRRRFFITASYDFKREPMTVAQLAAWVVEWHSRIIGLRTEPDRLAFRIWPNRKPPVESP
jgi:hypothetical protein